MGLGIKRKAVGGSPRDSYNACLDEPKLPLEGERVPGPRTPEVDWNRSNQTAFKQHRHLFFRCAVSRATDLFKLTRPLSSKGLVRLTRKIRELSPHAPLKASEPGRVFSVLDRLLPISTVMRPDLLSLHSQWVEEALKDKGHVLRLKALPVAGEPEEDGEFLYLPALKKCYTLIWRWLPVLVAGDPNPFEPSLETSDCNEILNILREDLSLQASTYLDLYPTWVEPREAAALFEKDRRMVRQLDPAKYRFKPWEGVPS